MTRIRDVRIAATEAMVRFGADGVVYMQSPNPLGAYPTRITEPLEEWAARAPDRPFLAQRDAHGTWRCLTYSQVLARVRNLSQALINRGLSQSAPVLILSGNSIEHALLALASMYSGVLYAPVAPAYSLQAREYGTLGRIFNLMKPRLVFAADGRVCSQTTWSSLSPRHPARFQPRLSTSSKIRRQRRRLTRRTTASTPTRSPRFSLHQARLGTRRA